MINQNNIVPESKATDSLFETVKGLPPHIQTFIGISNMYSKVYSFRSDEALKNSWNYAQDMRQDTFITSKLNKRYLGTVNKPWKIETVSYKKPASEALIDFVENAIRSIPEYHVFQYALHDSIWYGKQGIDAVWGDCYTPDGKIQNIIYHAPIIGDKIWFDFDGRPGVMINPMFANQYPKSMIRWWDRGTLLMLSDEVLDSGQFLFARNWKEDADFYNLWGGGRAFGVGIRDKVYWPWFLRNQSLGWIMEYMQRVGTDGVIIFYFEEGNQASEAAAMTNASLVRERNVLLLPRRVEKGSETASGVEHIAFSSAGVEHLRSMVESYFERHMEAMILGGNLIATSSAAAKDSYNEDFAPDFTESLKWDGMCYDACMNLYYIPYLLKKNGREKDIGTIRYRTVIPDPEKIDKMARLSKMVDWLELPEEEVREQIGFRKPREGEDTIGGMDAMIKMQTAIGNAKQNGSGISKTNEGEGSDDR